MPLKMVPSSVYPKLLANRPSTWKFHQNIINLTDKQVCEQLIASFINNLQLQSIAAYFYKAVTV